MRQWVIGRAADCDVIINVSEVSSHHCCLVQTAQGFFLEDLHSSNGTFVNGQRLVGRQRVTAQDRLTLGQTTPLPWPQEAVPMTAVEPGVITIGRAADNDVVLDFPTVSAHHARIRRDGGQWHLEDLGSTNGTSLGHPDRKITQATFGLEDVVFLGSLRLPAARLLAAASGPPTEKPQTSITFRGNALVIGRAPSCDLVLNYPMISTRHARLTRQGQQMFLEDLDSSNGTFVNHERLSGVVPIQPGDVIALGSFTLTVQDGGVLQRRDFRGDVTLEARQVAVEVPGKRLIEDCSLTIFPSELVGLMGPSGAGKTTLMRALNGYTPPAEGQVFLNGHDLYRHFDEYRLALGYVPQDDIIHRDLTVYQALFYSARLRLPPDYSDDDIDQRIRAVLQQLHLEGTEEVLIGSPEKKGISGGQRKRVNLAMELLTDPLVLFLDEPTSGLSSEDAYVVMKVLRQLADQGKTIFITIHQPSLEIFKLLDNLVLVGKDTNSAEPGRLLYYGPAFPEAIQFFNPQNLPGTNPTPDDVFRGLSKRPAAEWHTAYRQSKQYREYVAERAGQQAAGTGRVAGQKRHLSPLLFQWQTLVARCLAIKIRDRTNTAILLIQAPVVALLLVLVFGKQVSEPVTPENWPQVARGVGTTMFLLSLAALWFGASNAVREIVGEWAIYQRERMVNLRIPAYVASKFTVLGGLGVVQCTVLLLIAYWGCNLQAPWGLMYGLLLLSALVGVAIGLTLSALARSSEVAIALLPIILLAMVILGGAMQPIHRMHGVTQALCFANPARWAFEGMVVSEAERRPTFTPPLPPGTAPPVPRETQDMAENYFPKKDQRLPLGVSFAALGISLVLIGGSILGILRGRDISRTGT